MYYCSLPATHTPLNGEPSQVLLRMYGQLHDGNDSKPDGDSVTGTDGSDNKVTDCVITMLLAERNLGPKLYGIFPGGRLEEYIPVSNSLSNCFVKKLCRKLQTNRQFAVTDVCLYSTF